MRAREKILGLEPLLSKALDSLCMELAVTSCDENSLGLLEILHWRLNEEINQEEFGQLYQGWLEAKSITNIFGTRQLESFDKVELYSSEKLSRDMLTIIKITKALELINDEYNLHFMNRYGSHTSLEGMEKIFSYLDVDGVIHLRTSPVLFLFMALVLAGNITLRDKIIEGFLQQFSEFKQELNQIQGKVSLRNFKNYLARKCSEETINSLARLFKDLEKKLGGKDSLPNLFREAFVRWRTNPRFNQDKRKLEIFERIFEEHQHMLFTESPEDIQMALEQYYGEACLRLYGIDLQVIRELHQNIDIVLMKYVNSFLTTYQSELAKSVGTSRVVRQRDPKTATPDLNKLKKSLSASKFEPGSISRKMNNSIERLSRTLMTHTPPKNKARDSSNTPLGKTKSTTKASSKPEIGGIYRQVEQLQQLDFFRNKRVQPFEVVIRRLKQR